MYEMYNVIIRKKRKRKAKQNVITRKVWKKKIKTTGGQKYYDLLENIIERLERIEKKIDSYEFTE